MKVYTRVSSPDTDTRQDKSLDTAYDTGSDLESTQPHACIHSNTVLLDLDITQARLTAVDAPDSQKTGSPKNFPPTSHAEYCPDVGRPYVWDLMYVRQQPGETVHHY